MLRNLISWSLAVLLLTSVTAEGAQPANYETQTVAHLNIVLAKAGQEGRHAPSGLCLQTREGEFFSQTQFDADLKTLSQSYDRVEPLISADAQGLDIKIKVYPRPMIRTIRWEGVEGVSVRKLNKELGIEVSSEFDRPAFNMAFRKLEYYYTKRAFFEAKLSYDVQYDAEDNSVGIVITVNEGRVGHIGRINFCNFERCEENALLEMMASKEYFVPTSWLTHEGRFSAELAEHDKLVILNYLQNRGYADAQVKIEACQAPGEKRISMLITAQKGERYRFNTVTIEGNQLLDSCFLEAKLGFQAGDYFSPEAIREAVQRITNLYGNRGYIEAYVNYETKLLPDCAAYDVRIIIHEDKPYCVGLIKISGNCITRSRVILHECLLLPGEVFNIAKLQRTEEKLLNIGYFKNVNVYTTRSEGAGALPDNYRDVHIEVEEMPTGHFSLSGGYSTAESLFSEISITERNFDYTGLGRLFKEGPRALRGGGEYAHLAFTLGSKSRRYQLSWTKPFFMDTLWSVGFDVENSCNRYISDKYDILGTGFNLHADHPINALMRFSWHYRVKNTYTDTSDLTDSDKDRKLKKEIEDDQKRRGIISAAGFSITYDTTNRPVEPTEGLKSRLEFEVVGLGGDHRFLGFGYLNSYYIPIGKSGVLQFKADFKFLQTYACARRRNTPLDERLFLGGEYTVRGFRPYRLGPKFKHSDEPEGGFSLQYYSVEYSQPIFSRAEAFCFVDAGQLSRSMWHFSGVNVSIGYGARLSIFPGVPPVTIGMGYPLNAKNKTDVKRFFLNIGGRF